MLTGFRFESPQLYWILDNLLIHILGHSYISWESFTIELLSGMKEKIGDRNMVNYDQLSICILLTMKVALSWLQGHF